MSSIVRFNSLGSTTVGEESENHRNALEDGGPDAGTVASATWKKVQPRCLAFGGIELETDGYSDTLHSRSRADNEDTDEILDEPLRDSGQPNAGIECGRSRSDSGKSLQQNNAY
jgi:hypothetical protein